MSNTVQSGFNPEKIELYKNYQKNKVLLSWYYTKLEIDDMLKQYALSGDTYSKGEVYSKLETLSKEEIINLFLQCAKEEDIKGFIKLLDLKEDISHKTTQITSGSTNTEYPTAKAVYDKINELEEKINLLSSKII